MVSTSFIGLALFLTAGTAVCLPADQAIPPERRGDIFMARKQYREAIDAYGQCSQDSPVILNKTGIAFHQLLELQSARRFYERSIKLNPQYAEGLNNLGTVYYTQKSYRRAISYYKRALAVNPKSASILSNLGTAYFGRKKYKEAVDTYQQALALDPEVFEHHNSQGVLIQERTVEERAKYHYYMAKLYAKSGMDERAMQYVRKALEEGFRDRNKLRQDPEFAKLRELPEFQQLLTWEPRVL